MVRRQRCGLELAVAVELVGHIRGLEIPFQKLLQLVEPKARVADLDLQQQLRRGQLVAAQIGVRVKLDSAGAVTEKPTVVGMYTDCL